MFVNEKAREKAIEKELGRRGNSGDTQRISWKGEMKSFPVISLGLKNVVLNPNSHRIQSQVSSHPKEERLRSEPYSEYSQKEFSKMLRDTQEYESLKENLKEEGQREPGVVTRQGLLVNANRRVTALRELEGEHHVRVVVLPKNVSREEVLNVEANLQVREDFKAEYTYTNQLILIDNMIEEYGRSKKEVALKLRLATSSADSHLKEGVEKVETYLSQLSLIRQAQNLVQEQNIPYTFFDDKQQIVSEIVDEYRSTKRTSGYKEAKRLKNNRLIGLLSDYKYRELRRVDQDFVDDFFLDSAKEIEEDLSVDFRQLMEVSHEGGDSGQEELGLDVLKDEDEEEEEEKVFDAEPLVKTLARAHDARSVQVPTTDGKEDSIPSETIIEDTWNVLEQATEKKRLDEKEEDRITTPIKRTRMAASKLKKARKTYKKASKHPGFDHNKMDNKIKDVERALENLKDTVNRE